jgi:hypothetical protein
LRSPVTIAAGLLLLARCRVGPSQEPAANVVEVAEPSVDTSDAIVFERHFPAPTPPPHAWVDVRVLTVVPYEFSNLIRSHMPSDEPLRDCVLPEHRERTEADGEMRLSCFVGSLARVTTVTVEACEFSDPQICECMSEHVARWRFPAHAQNVQVDLRVRTGPRN